MRIFANHKIKALFNKILICMLVLTLLSVAFLVLKPENAALYILLSSLGMGIIILAVCYGYFKKAERNHGKCRGANYGLYHWQP